MTGISKKSGKLYSQLCAARTAAERKRIIAGVDDVSVLDSTQALVEQFAIDAEKGGDFKGVRFYGSISKQLVLRMEKLKSKMEELKPKEVHMSKAEQERILADMGFQLEDDNNSWWRHVVIFSDVSVNVGVFLSTWPGSKMELNNSL